jgi:thymidine kinase
MSSMSQNVTGYLELIIGPMYSGKTSKLLEIYKQCEFCDINVAVINYAEDVRYHDEMLSTHDKVMIPCVQCTELPTVEECIKLVEIMSYLDKNNECSDIFKKKYTTYSKISSKDTKVILINEGQFFGNLKEFVIEMLYKNKKIYVSGLDGDFKREKFGQILDLIPLCDKVTKLTSLCSICKDGTPGIFSLRLSEEEQQKVIGSDNYIPVCRKCYILKSQN